MSLPSRISERLITMDACTLGICSLCSGPSGEPQYTICIPCSLEFMDDDASDQYAYPHFDHDIIRAETDGLDEPYDYDRMFEEWLDRSPLNRLEHLMNLNQEAFGSACSQLWHHQIGAFIAIDRVLGYDEPPCPF